MCLFRHLPQYGRQAPSHRDLVDVARRAVAAYGRADLTADLDAAEALLRDGAWVLVLGDYTQGKPRLVMVSDLTVYSDRIAELNAGHPGRPRPPLLMLGVAAQLPGPASAPSAANESVRDHVAAESGRLGWVSASEVAVVAAVGQVPVDAAALLVG